MTIFFFTAPSLLFQRVILMSGSALSPLKVSLTNGKELARKFASAVKCPVQPPSNMLECLRQIPLQYFLDSEVWNICTHLKLYTSGSCKTVFNFAYSLCVLPGASDIMFTFHDKHASSMIPMRYGISLLTHLLVPM